MKLPQCRDTPVSTIRDHLSLQAWRETTEIAVAAQLPRSSVGAR